MDLIIDANVLFAALIKENVTSDLLFKCNLYAPEFILFEFAKYKIVLLEKTKRTEEDFTNLFELFKRNVILIPHEEILPFVKKAEKISPDLKDVPYIALALKLGCAIWSNDKELKEKQKTVKIYSTEELVKKFY